MEGTAKMCIFGKLLQIAQGSCVTGSGSGENSNTVKLIGKG